MRAQHAPAIVSGNGIPSFFWLFFLLCFCSSAFARAQRVDAVPPPPGAWLLSGTLVLICVALTLRSLRNDRERAHG